MSKWPGFDLHAELIADVERRFWTISSLREASRLRQAQRELEHLERRAAREARRDNLARQVQRSGLNGLVAPSPEDVAARRDAAAQGLRLAVPMYFTDDEIRHIRGVPGGPGVIAALSRQHGISRQGIHAIRSRATYAHVSDETVRPDSGPDSATEERSAAR